jgi:hypothetical protein
VHARAQRVRLRLQPRHRLVAAARRQNAAHVGRGGSCRRHVAAEPFLFLPLFFQIVFDVLEALLLRRKVLARVGELAIARQPALASFCCS